MHVADEEANGIIRNTESHVSNDACAKNYGVDIWN